MLSRSRSEVARTTSIVHDERGARVDEDVPALSEEIMVLEGVVFDERGDYPSATRTCSTRLGPHHPLSRST